MRVGQASGVVKRMFDVAVVLAALAVFVGSVVQGSVGFGMAMLAAPFVTLLDPTLMPGSLLLVGGALAASVSFREWRHADWSGLGWAVAGRVVGVTGGIWLVTVASPRLLGAVVGGTVLAAVLVTLRAVRIRVTSRSLVVAGAISGVTGTATSIGGPPIALLYQHAAGPRLRGTLGAFLFSGALVSIGALVVTGRLHARELAAASLMIPFMIAGFALSGPLSRHLDAGRVRSAVLALASLSAVALLVRAVL